MKIDLKGLPAVIVIVVILIGTAAYRSFLHSSLPDDPKVRQELELRLMSEIAGDITADTEAIREAMRKGDKAKSEELAKGLLKRKVEINDLAMRGSGDDIIIKATYTIDGPDGPKKCTGYYRFTHSLIAGWRYQRETSSFSWYTKLF